MPVAQGSCPSCGSPIEFGLGSSLSKVCTYCRATVLRTDRGLQNLGRVADLANTPCLVAIGDRGTLAGRPLEILGRVQLDTGEGPWDEFYVAFDYGQSWGWLAYAQGRWHLTQAIASGPLPEFEQLRLEQDVFLGPVIWVRVAEIRQATIRSAEGELPGAFPTGFIRHYADGYGPQGAFATLDYGDRRAPPVVYFGAIIPEDQLAITALGPRTTAQVETTYLRCPNCGGDVPKLGGNRSERLGCPYCGAMSDIAEQKVLAQQERLLATLDIPIGTRGQLDGVEYLCLAYVRRSSTFDDELYSWEEYLLFAPSLGFRWLVKDPETGWSFVAAVSPADLDLSQAPAALGYFGRNFGVRNRNLARVDYVLGEIYWKCSIGETVEVSDYASGNTVISREQTRNEVNYSHCTPISYKALATAFGLPLEGPGSRGFSSTPAAGSMAAKLVLIGVVLVACVLLLAFVAEEGNGTSSGSAGLTGLGMSRGSSYRGGGTYYGGK